MECLKLKFRSVLLQFLTICMVVGLITPVRSVSALEEEIETITQEEVEPVIIGEDDSLRDESVKTFILSDKSYQAILYSIPVHYQEEGVWKEIDNTLIDDGLSVEEDVLSAENEQSSNNEVLDTDNEESSLSVEQEDQTSLEETVTEEVIETNTEEIIETNVGVETSFTVDQEDEMSSNEVVESSTEEIIETHVDEETSFTVDQEDEVSETNNEEIVVTDVNEETTSTNISVIEDESETESQASTTDDEVVGYKNKEGNFKIKFAKKAHKKNMVSFQDGEYKVTWGFSDLTNKSAGVVTTKEETDDEIQKVINKIGQTITYANILDGIDIIYHIDSLQIKEDIVISHPTDINEFTFEYKVNNLTLELTDEGSIEAKNEDGEVIFVMPKPYMYDSNGVYSDDVHYEITQKNKKYTITVVADKDWMHDESRAYPIIIDPVIKTDTTKEAIDTTFIASKWSNTNFSVYEELLVGNESSYGICRTLLKFELPELNPGDMIIDADLNIACFNHSFYTSTTPDMQVNAHLVTSKWTLDEVKWTSKPSYENIVLDHDFIKKTDTTWVANWKQFDITRAVKEWYGGATTNYGILLKPNIESDSNQVADLVKYEVKGCLWPERYNDLEDVYPFIALTYRNNKGLESYYDYTTFSTTHAGTVSIDNYSGNLVVTKSLSSTHGSRMPVNVSLVYNGYLTRKEDDTDTDSPKPIIPWRSSFNQTLLSSSKHGLKEESVAIYPYVYKDGDGTEHYFINVDNTYKDEDGLGLELKLVSGGGYTITDKADNVMTFASDGNLSSIKDAIGNEMRIEYDSTTLIDGNAVGYVIGGNGYKVTFSYDEDGRLISTEGDNSYTLIYDDNGFLTDIECNNGMESQYTYDAEGSMTSMSSISGSIIEFYYTSTQSGKQVSQVVEKTENGAIGQTIKFDRSKYNTTIITTSGVDCIIDTEDDVMTELQFDDSGHLLTKKVYTADKELGANAFEYTSAKADNSNVESLNRITKAGTTSKSVTNLLTNYTGSTTNGWELTTPLDIGIDPPNNTSLDGLFEDNSYLISKYNYGPIGITSMSQTLGTTVIQPNTTYTASVYLKTDDLISQNDEVNDGGQLIVIVKDSSGNETTYKSKPFVGTTDEDINDGWRRVAVTLTTPSNVSSVTYQLSANNVLGKVYFDGLQFEEGNVANPYNLIENAGFEKITSNLPNRWSTSNLTSSDIVDTSIKNQGSYSFKMTPSVGVEKKIYKTINLNNSKEEDSYVLSGWCYGQTMEVKASPSSSTSSRKAELAITVHYSDGTSKKKDSLSFVKSIEDWKYGVKVFDLSDESDTVKTPTKLEISVISYDQANTLYFDDIQLIRSKVGAAKYDDEGNLVYSDYESFTYDDNGNMLSYVDKVGQTTSYTYDDKNQLISTTLPSGVKEVNNYDIYGNLLNANASNSDGTLNVKTEKVYDSATHSFVTKTIDEEGKATLYDYDEETGVLNSATDAKGNTTEYLYDWDHRLEMTIVDGNEIFYVRNAEELLEQIVTPTTTYTYSFDEFKNIIETEIGSTTISTVDFKSNNGDAKKVTLGNGFYEEYEYDEYGNVIQVKENGQLAKEYIYDTAGNIHVTIDHKSNVRIQYYFDFEDRIAAVDYYNYSTGAFEYTHEYAYDKNNRLIKVNYNDGSVIQTIEYTYDTKNNLEKTTIDSNASINYSYDSLDRVTTKAFDTGTKTLTSSYVYDDSSRGDTFTTTKVKQEVIDKMTYNYLYDELGNIIQIKVKYDNEAEKTIDYTYDKYSQIARENNEVTNQTIVYTYDNLGNIKTRKEYAYTTANSLGTAIKTVNYTYGNTQWKDQLTSYDGQTITYDEIGNPESYKGYVLDWNGKQLLSLTKNNSTIELTYGADGLRKTKKVGTVTTTYDYDGITLIHQSNGTYDLYYSYDDNGILAKISHVAGTTTTDYYVLTNTRQEIEAIYDASGNLVARYIYDTWGNIEKIVNSSGTTITDPNNIGHINPIRYKGYYYDQETGLYYLQSRYYDPDTGRFLSADSVDILNVTPLSFTDKNLYTYCDNNPVNRKDSGGGFWESAFDVVSLCASVADVLREPTNPWNWAAAIGDTIDLFPFVTGCGEATKLTKLTIEAVDKSDDVIKATRKLANTDQVKGMTGFYEIIFESGNNYAGKGGLYRATVSAKNKLKKHTDDRVISITWIPAKDEKHAFLGEYYFMKAKGVRNQNTYNLAWSPGRKEEQKWWFDNLGR